MPSNQASAAKKIKLNRTKVSLETGDKVTLKLKNATGKITWGSSKKSVATVNKKGKAKISAKNAGKKYICTVTVKANEDTDPSTVTPTPLPTPIPVAKGTLSETIVSLEFPIVTTKQLSLSGATVQSWTSSNQSVATVDATGKITALSTGMVDITCTDTEGFTYTCRVSILFPRFTVEPGISERYFTGKSFYYYMPIKITNALEHKLVFDNYAGLFWLYSTSNADDYQALLLQNSNEILTAKNLSITTPVTVHAGATDKIYGYHPYNIQIHSSSILGFGVTIDNVAYSVLTNAYGNIIDMKVFS